MGHAGSSFDCLDGVSPIRANEDWPGGVTV